MRIFQGVQRPRVCEPILVSRLQLRTRVLPADVVGLTSSVYPFRFAKERPKRPIVWNNRVNFRRRDVWAPESRLCRIFESQHSFFEVKNDL
jgi:hypothetical protein